MINKLSESIKTVSIVGDSVHKLSQNINTWLKDNPQVFIVDKSDFSVKTEFSDVLKCSVIIWYK